MTQPLDFSNQDLRNRSFKGRQDLAGANFQKADIRGCDFSKANLKGADFSEIKAGRSGKQIFITLLITLMVTVTGAYTGMNVGSDEVSLFRMGSGAFMGASSIIVSSVVLDARIGAFWGTSRVAFWGTSIGATWGFGTYLGALTIKELSKSNTVSVILLSLLALVFFWATYFAFKLAFEDIQNETGTSFKESILTNAKFTYAILKNCEFTGTNMVQTDWENAYFIRCKFSGRFNNQLVRELYVSKIGINRNFSFIDLLGLNLTGVNLRGANLTAANLNETNLSQADLENANLCNVQAIRTDFTGANLSGACIENWAITSETDFTHVVCSHIFLNSARTERQPASGFLEQGDFAKLITQSTKSLDFFFRNGIDPQAFDFALNNLMVNYREMGISLKSVEDFGDGDRIVRFKTVSDAPKGEMHDQFTQDYEEMQKQLESSRNKVCELQQKLDRIDLEPTFRS